MFGGCTENVVLWKKFSGCIRDIKTCPRCKITEFEWKVAVQNHEFGWVLGMVSESFFLNY